MSNQSFEKRKEQHFCTTRGRQEISQKETLVKNKRPKDTTEKLFQTHQEDTLLFFSQQSNNNNYNKKQNKN
jgi:hypothetical protein